MAGDLKGSIEFFQTGEQEPLLEEIKVACILDPFSYECFRYECKLIPIGPDDWKETLSNQKPDFLFVESAWEGNNGQWLYKIVDLEFGDRNFLRDLIAWCKQNNIPTVFWAKEDPFDFDRFIEAAKLFNFVFTTDEDCIPQYKKILCHEHVYVLPFAAQPRIHNPVFRNQARLGEVAFAGSWYRRTKLYKRKEYMRIMLQPAFRYNLHIYDRCYGMEDPGRIFPDIYQPYIRPSVPYTEMGKIYKSYDVFLNVNSATESPTMFSRRVCELLACGANVISSYSLAVERLFPGIVKLCKTQEDTNVYLRMLLDDEDLRDRLSLLGQRTVFSRHTYRHRMEMVLNHIGIKYTRKEEQGISIITCTKDTQSMNNVFENYENQSYEKKELIIILCNNNMNFNEWELYAATFQNVRVYQLDEHVSLGECLNFAVQKASHEIVSIFDEGDHYSSEYLGDIVNAFNYTGASIVGKYTHYAYLESYKALVLCSPHKENGYEPYIYGSTLNFKKEIFKDVRFINQSGDVDSYFLRSCLDNGYKVYAADRFNYAAHVPSSVEDYSWKVSEKEFLEEWNYRFIATTDDYRSLVTV